MDSFGSGASITHHYFLRQHCPFHGAPKAVEESRGKDKNFEHHIGMARGYRQAVCTGNHLGDELLFISTRHFQTAYGKEEKM